MTTKGDLIESIAEKAGLTKKESEKALNTCLEVIKEDLANGENLRIMNFGSFSVVERKERSGRNPQTGEEIKIPAQKTIKFKPGKDLKEKVEK